MSTAKLVNKSIDNRAAFNLLQNADHIMAVAGEPIVLKGFIIRNEVDSDGVEKLATYALTQDKAYFGGAASFTNSLRELGSMFESDIVGDGLTVVFDTKEVGKQKNTIWFAELK